MKKLLFILGLLITFMAQGQIRYQNLGTKDLSLAARVPGSLYIDSAMFLPLKGSLNSFRLTRAGALVYQISDSSLYVWTTNQWLKVQGGGGGGVANLGVSTSAGSLTISNSNGTGIPAFPLASGSQAGALSAFDWNAFNAKLNAVNLGVSRTPTTVVVTNDAGSPSTIPLVDAGSAGVVSPTMKTTWDNKLGSISVQNSIAGTGLPGGGLQLVNDAASPGANMVYGTSAVGAKGWKPDPAGGGGSSEIIQTTFASLDASSGLATNKIYRITDADRYGDFMVVGTVADQSSDNGGTVIVNSGLQQLVRRYSGPIDLRWFGLVQDAVAGVGSYGSPTGTDQKTVFDKAVAAAAANQKIICEGCTFFIGTKLAPFSGAKPVNIEINGTIYLAADTLFQVYNASGDYDHNNIYVERIIGKGNIPTNGPTAHTNGTSPVWSNLTSTVLYIKNSNKGTYRFNRVWGVKTVVDIYGSGGAGSQENTIDGVTWYDCANHVLFRSGDGNSFCDKNKIGWGSVLRLSGGLALHFDGGPGNTGAMRSNKMDFLIEYLDSIIYSHADVTNPALIFTIEGGLTTGVFGNPAINISNTFRSPYWGGSGVLGASLVGNANMGQGGLINMEIWNGTYKIGDRHFINSDGTITTVRRNQTITNTNLTNLLTSYPNWKFTTEDAELEASVSTTYSLAAQVRWLTCTGASPFTVTFPATSYSGRLVTVKNASTATVTVSGVTGVTSIPAGQSITYRAFQSGGYQNITNLTGTSGSGSASAGAFVSTPNPQGATDNGAGVISVTAADLTNPGSVAVGDQVMPSGIKTFQGVGIQGAGFSGYNFIGRQNGLSWNDNSTPNSTSTTLTALNFGSGSSAKDIVFGVGKTSVNWVGFGNNGTDFMFLTEKSTGGFEFRKAVGYSAMTLTSGSLMGKVFGTSGNWLIQTGGTAVDAGYKLDVFGNVRFNNAITLGSTSYWAPTGQEYALKIDEFGNVGSMPFPTGTGGGSSIFTAGSGTGTPYYHSSGAVNIGVNPSQSWAWTHWGASCSTCGPSSTQRSIWEFASTSVYVPTPRTHSMDYNGSYLRFTPGNGVPGRIVTENNGLTITNGAIWDGAAISLAKQGTASAVNGDQVVADGTGASKTVKPYNELIFTTTTPVLISTISVGYTSIFTGGAKTIPSLLAGDIVEVKGSGGINANNVTWFRFDVLGQQIDINPVNTVAVSPEKNFEYEVKVMSKASGTNAGGSIKIKLKLEGETEYHIFTSDYTSGLNTSGTGTINVSARYTSGSSPLLASVDNTIEVKRQVR